MKHITSLACAVGLLLSFTGCQTSTTNENPPVRSPGDGGRGMSPQHHSHTQSSQSR